MYLIWGYFPVISLEWGPLHGLPGKETSFYSAMVRDSYLSGILKTKRRGKNHPVNKLTYSFFIPTFHSLSNSKFFSHKLCCQLNSNIYHYPIHFCGCFNRTMATRRGWIKKIRFAPGRGNMKFFILYIDGFDIWDLKDGKVKLKIVLNFDKTNVDVLKY